MAGEVPVIDMIGNDDQCSKLKETCEKWGCFRVVNHGVPTNLIAEIKSVSLDLFDRPVEVKQRNKTVLPGSGYVPSNSVNPVYEAFTLDMPTSQCLATFLSDLEASPHQREIIEKYDQSVHKLAIDVARKIAESMGLDDYNSFEVRPAHFRINKYNITQQTTGSCGFPTHTDTTLLTILQEDEIFGGLEVVDPSGEFATVDPSPGSLFVILGDTAQAWSNGNLRNVQHRVVPKDAGVRVSIATFFSPVDETIIAHPKFIEGDCPPMYVPFTYAELRNLRASKKMFAGEVLQFLRSSN